MSYEDTLREHRRLGILITLAQTDTYRSNTSVLQEAVDAYGIPSTRDQIDGEAAWLADQGLVTIKAMENGVTVVKLTERGADVAAGRARVPGVRRPSARG